MEEWNLFLRKFKKTCATPNFKHPEFWDELKPFGASISLIHDGEALSDISLRGSKRVRTSMLIRDSGLELTFVLSFGSSSIRNSTCATFTPYAATLAF